MATDIETFQPPYMSWKTFEGLIEMFAGGGLPARIDKSVLSSRSGSDQQQFLRAANAFRLREENGVPTDRMKALVENPEGRGEIVAQFLRENYGPVIALPEDATQDMLDQAFRELGVEGADTIRKAETFYLNAAKVAGIPVSPHFKQVRPGAGGRRRRTTTRRGASGSTANGTAERLPPPPPDPFKGMHPAIQTLVKALPEFSDDDPKPEFPEAERKAWFAYATATFNLIYDRPEGDTGGNDE